MSRDGIKERVSDTNDYSRNSEEFEIYKNLKFTIIFQGIGELFFCEETGRKTEIGRKLVKS